MQMTSKNLDTGDYSSNSNDSSSVPTEEHAENDFDYDSDSSLTTVGATSPLAAAPSAKSAPTSEISSISASTSDLNDDEYDPRSRIITLAVDQVPRSGSRAGSSTANSSVNESRSAPRRRGRPPGVASKHTTPVIKVPKPKSSFFAQSSSAIPLPTAEVELDKILFMKTVHEPDTAPRDDYLIKFKNRSYLHCEWVDREWIETHDKRGKLRIRHFLEKTIYDFAYGLLSEEKPFNDSYIKIDRLIDHIDQYPDPFSGEMHKWFLVKWSALPYENCTWETEMTLMDACDDADEQIDLFHSRSKVPSQRDPHYYDTFIPPTVRPPVSSWKKLESSPEYRDGNTLRPYQLEGLNWLMYCWHHNQSSLIADEMGLGKTVQSVAFLNELSKLGVRGPFLIIAPLSTISHWERTITGWTDLNCVIFHGSNASRNIIHNYEYFYTDQNTRKRIDLIGPPEALKNNAKFVRFAYNQHKFDVVLTTYEMAINASPMLKNVGLWRCVVVDEAHRLKNKTSKVGEVLKTYSFEHKLLLTGTPIQNSLEELWSILNFLDPEKFPDGTEKSFMSTYDLRSAADVERLQSILKPLMLRRLKEDVEKSIPVKEETIIEVELTDIQRAYYRAILERNFPFLKQGTKRHNMPNLINAMMELRKCCIHPYLLRGAEEKVTEDARATTAQDQFKCMIEASGKLVLLDKLLPKLKVGGHKVLIFSQMTKCLDLLSDYLRGKGYVYERIDGGVRGDARTSAIDRFCAPDSEVFIFLLCTRAGGVGINLTAADTCIIFDSDWNPQNDLQAQARCHRIGQKKNVKIYRLITRNTYERTMFDKAGLKLGLDRAVLSRMDFDPSDTSAGPVSSLSKNEIEELLRRGAYAAIMNQDENGTNESKDFCEEDIDSILARRCQTIRHGEDGADAIKNEGSLFSKASFALEGNISANLDVNDPEFWEKWAQKAEIETAVPEEVETNILPSDSRRKRKRVDRIAYESDEEKIVSAQISQIPTELDDEEYISWSQRRDARTTAAKESGGFTPWTMAEKTRIERGLMAYGFGAWEKKKESFSKRSINDIKAVELRLIRWCLSKLKKDRDISDDKKTPLKDHVSDAEDEKPEEEKGRQSKTKARVDFQSLRDDLRLFADIEHVLKSVHWDIPTTASVEKMIHSGCSSSFLTSDEKIDRHDELGEYPYPNATLSNLLEFRSFLDDASKEYFEHLEKKPRNILFRVQTMHFLREHVFDIDPHAVSELWLSAERYEKEAEFKFEEPRPIWIDKYQRLFEVRNSSFVFPGVYHSAFGTVNEENSTSASAIAGWAQEQDRDVLLGMLKFGYQNYEKIRDDASLVFKNHWITNEVAKRFSAIDGQEMPKIWPGGSELGTRIRKMINVLTKNIRDQSKAEYEVQGTLQSLEASVNDHCWSKKDKSEYFRACNCLGIPELEEIETTDEEASKNKWIVLKPLAENKVIAKRRDWELFREVAALDHKTDYALEQFTCLFIRRAEDFVKNSAANGLTGDLCVSGRITGEPLPDNTEDQFPEPEVRIVDLSGSSLDPCSGMALERARRLLRRVVFMRSIRTHVLQDPNLDMKLTFAKKSPGLPEWWVPGLHDRAFLEGVSKHGMTPLRQNQIMFDPELPFRPIVEEKLAAAGYEDQLAHLIQQATLTKNELKEVRKSETHQQEDNDDEGAVDVGGINLEEVVGWPRDLIRSRRVDILMDLVMNPSHKAMSMLQRFGKDVTGSFTKLEEDGDVAIDSGALMLGKKVLQLRNDKDTLNSNKTISDSPLTEEEQELVSSSIRRLNQAIKYIQRNENSRSLLSVLKEHADYYPEIEEDNDIEMESKKDHEVSMNLDSSNEEDGQEPENKQYQTSVE